MATASFRTHMVSELGEVELGTSVKLAGWIAFRRRQKRVAFVGLRDGSGTVQVVCAPEEIAGVSRESCVTVSGVVRARLAPDNRHPDTPQVEVADGRVEVLAPAATLPFAVEGSEADTEARRRWRYLDMRRGSARRHLLVRGQLPSVLRRSVQQEGFVELETPYLAHPSSGGAREFQVSSTRFPARQYVLPQSSQVYRTLLMAGGFERCYQISRNFRDEWLRGGRQLEFSVLDLEAAFVTRDDIMGWIEIAVARAVCELLDREVEVPFRRVPFGQELRGAGHLRPSLDFAWIVDHPLFVRREGRLDTFHQPFDAPADGWEGRLEDAPLEVPSTYFTLVSDGRELGGGSMRIHRPDLLRRILQLVGQADTNAAVVEALRYGAPPHGGFTLALDGFAALLLGERSIRSVIPFPKSSGDAVPSIRQATAERARTPSTPSHGRPAPVRTGCRCRGAVVECGSRQRPTLLVAGLSFAPTLRRRGPCFRSRKAPGLASGYRKRLGRTPPVPSRAGANVDRSRHSWSAAARARPAGNAPGGPSRSRGG